MAKSERPERLRDFSLDGEYVATQARAAVSEMFAPVVAAFRFAERLTRPKSLQSQLAARRLKSQRAKPAN